MATAIRDRVPDFLQLMRFDRPIGTLLLLWPTLWALWIAADGIPDWHILLIFVLGVVVMRAAGCVINDYADRNIDGRVKRTQTRPIVSGKVSEKEALLLFISLLVVAFILVLFTNQLTILLSGGAVLLAAAYPFMKRYTHMPQVVLGAAFSWSIPMAFAAQTGSVPPESWLLYVAVVIWTVAYDTFYAMVDRDDDIKIGVKSTAILFGDMDRAMTTLLQIIVLVSLLIVADRFDLGTSYLIGIGIAGLLFCYQQFLIRYRHRDDCFKAFLNNNWVGMVVFVGIFVDKTLN